MRRKDVSSPATITRRVRMNGYHARRIKEREKVDVGELSPKVN